MNKTLVALSAIAVLGLAACGDDVVEEGDTMVIENESVEPVDTAPAESDGDSFSISEDGVTADFNNGDTSISIDADGNPSMSVESD